MTRGILATLLFAVVTIAGVANAASSLYQFDSSDQAQRFEVLTRQLRCLVCQGESIADSHADLAKDMRTRVHDMIVAGRSNQQIIQFMTDRYGEFILYRPPFVPRTYLLWVGPLLLLLLACAVIMYCVRSARRKTASNGLEHSERERLSRLLDESGESKTGRMQT